MFFRKRTKNLKFKSSPKQIFNELCDSIAAYTTLALLKDDKRVNYDELRATLMPAYSLLATLCSHATASDVVIDVSELSSLDWVFGAGHAFLKLSVLHSPKGETWVQPYSIYIYPANGIPLFEAAILEGKKDGLNATDSIDKLAGL